MNVLFLTSSMPRYSNDSQVSFVLDQALAWKKARPEDKIFILAPHDRLAKREEKTEDIHIFRFVYWWPLKWQRLAYPAILPNIRKNPLLVIQVPFFLLGELWATLRIVRRFKISVIFAHWVMPQGLIAYITKKLLGTAYGLKNYSSDLRVFRKLPLIGRPLARRIINNAEVLFCENTKLREEALNFFSKSDRPSINKKIVALCMGAFQSCEAKPHDNSIKDRYDFGFIGRLTKKKGVHFFIQALKVLRQDGVSFHAVIAGDGEEAGELKKIAEGCPIDFIGFVSGQEKLDFFHQAKICVFPSCENQEDIEGLPVALLEALYLGKTVIASKDTNIELLPEWNEVKENICFLSDPRDINHFAGLLREAAAFSDSEAARRSLNTQAAFKRYQWDNLIQEYLRPFKTC